MMKSWLSRYSARYVRSLVYMLQASEYHIRDYLAWYHRVNDFTHVERRKRLVFTPKAMVIFAIAIIGALCAALAAIACWWVLSQPLGALVFVLLVLLYPILIGYGIVVPVVLLELVVQRPIELIVARRIRRALRAHSALVVGIAGSFGKTSMREILRVVLSAGKKVAAPPHSYNTLLGINTFVAGLDGDEDVLVFELGEYYPGDVERLCRVVQPDIGVITGVNEAHLQKFRSLDRTASTIFELADCVGSGRVYVNAENELARQSARPGHILYSREGVGDWEVESAQSDLSGTSFTMAKDDTRLELASKLLGLHQVGPLSAAVDIAYSLGMSVTQIENGVAKTQPFEHRLESRRDDSNIVTLDDSYNGNPDGVQAVINFLASLEGHRRFYVTPGLVEMGPRTEQVHRQIGRSLADAHIEKVVLIRNSVTPFIEEGLKERDYKGDILWFDDGPAAFAALPHLTVSGDVVLLQNDWPDQYQ